MNFLKKMLGYQEDENKGFKQGSNYDRENFEGECSLFQIGEQGKLLM